MELSPKTRCEEDQPFPFGISPLPVGMISTRPPDSQSGEPCTSWWAPLGPCGKP